MTEREQQLAGLATEWRTLPYTWRDCALYALAVGADGREPQYTYEKDMQVIPTFGVLPYWGAVNVTPKFPRPRAIPVLVEERLQPERSYVNLDFEFLYHRPIPAGKGSFVYRDVLTDLFDRGEGRGMAVRSQVEVFDEGGVLLCTNRCTTLFPTLGGYGGQPMPAGPAASPTGSRTLWRGTTSGRPAPPLPPHRGHQPGPRGPGRGGEPGPGGAPSSTTCAPLATPAGWPSASSSPASRSGWSGCTGP